MSCSYVLSPTSIQPNPVFTRIHLTLLLVSRHDEADGHHERERPRGEARCLRSREKSFSRSEVYSFRATAVQGQGRPGACCGWLPLAAGKAVAKQEQYTAAPGERDERMMEEWMQETSMLTGTPPRTGPEPPRQHPGEVQQHG